MEEAGHRVASESRKGIGTRKILERHTVTYFLIWVLPKGVNQSMMPESIPSSHFTVDHLLGTRLQTHGCLPWKSHDLIWVWPPRIRTHKMVYGKDQFHKAVLCIHMHIMAWTNTRPTHIHTQRALIPTTTITSIGDSIIKVVLKIWNRREFSMDWCWDHDWFVYLYLTQSHNISNWQLKIKENYMLWVSSLDRVLLEIHRKHHFQTNCIRDKICHLSNKQIR